MSRDAPAELIRLIADRQTAAVGATVGMVPVADLAPPLEVLARMPGAREGGASRPGSNADILAVDGDPIADPGSLHRIRAVYARGVAVPDVAVLSAEVRAGRRPRP